MSDILEEDLPMTLDEVLPFLIISRRWEEKDVNFIVHNLNALCGSTSWELLTQAEREELNDWLERNNVNERRWIPLKKELGKDISDIIDDGVEFTEDVAVDVEDATI